MEQFISRVKSSLAERLELAQSFGKIGEWEFDFLSGSAIWSKEVYNFYEVDLDLPPVLFHESDEYYRPEEKTRLFSLIERLRLTRTAQQDVFQVHLPNGKVKWHRSLLIPEVDVNGQLVHMHGLLQDITDEMMARTRLKEEQVFFQSVLDSIPADIAVYSEDQRYLYINETAVADAEARKWIVNKNDFDYFTMRGLPLDRAYKRQAQFRSMLEGKEKKFFEEHSVKNGKDIYKLRQFAPIWDKQTGKLRYVIGYGVDITDWKLSEQRLVSSGIAMEASTDGIAILGADETYQYLNNAHISMFGYDAEEDLKGKTWRAIYPNPEVERIEKILLPLLMQEGYWQGETVGKKKDGTLFHQEITLSALPNGGMICICRDISKRRERDEEMQKLALVSNRSNNIILILDNQRRVDWVNDSFLRLTGRTKEEVLGTRFPSETPGWSNDNLPPWLQFGMHQHQHMKGELAYYTATGEEIWLQGEINPVYDDNGEFRYSACILNDITLIKAAEKNALTALHKERALSELKSRFVSLASHEFRTPLAGILSSTDIIREYADTIEDEAAVRILNHTDRIAEEVLRMTEIMNNVLLLGKMDAGKIPFRPGSGDIHEFIQTHLRRVSTAFRERVRFNGPGRPVHTRFDPNLLDHILNNLLSNAAKYSPAELDIFVDLLPDESDGIQIVVRDKGIGIPAKELPFLYESFFRGSNTNDFHGTGLGLPLVKQFVDLHGWSIRIQSEENNGTDVTIIIPTES